MPLRRTLSKGLGHEIELNISTTMDNFGSKKIRASAGFSALKISL
jgi:hypothetical protein